MKVFSLIFMVTFAIIAASLVFTPATRSVAKGNGDFTVCYDNMHLNDGDFVTPQGDPIDCPGGPTLTP